MASVIPAFATALQDRTLRGTPREVYVWLHQNLDVVEFRPVKHASVGFALGLKDASVADSIVRLLNRGYLERGEKTGQTWTYRLVYSVPEERFSLKVD